MARIAILLSLLPFAFAFSDTTPFVAWSSQSSSVLDRLPASAAQHDSTSLLKEILLNQEICNHDAVVIINQPGLHASDLRILPASSHVVRSLEKAPCSRQYPYVPHNSSAGVSHLPAFASSVSDICNSRLVTVSLGQEGVEFEVKEKHTIVIDMPLLDIGSHRKEEMLEYDTLLSATVLEKLPFPNHIVVYTGTSPESSAPHFKRQTPTKNVLQTSSSTPRPTLKTGIFHQYQLLTPGLITSLLLVIFVMLPILTLSLKALASVQSPTISAGASKTFSATEKKNQ